MGRLQTSKTPHCNQNKSFRLSDLFWLELMVGTSDIPIQSRERNCAAKARNSFKDLVCFGDEVKNQTKEQRLESVEVVDASGQHKNLLVRHRQRLR
mmetsp:Transcript_55899/g.155876  ORF Transcript_55899/g.155876 Transcript_55899/m.155876 type:complete len:96 (-) Transcript_55899:1130-1417(-)